MHKYTHHHGHAYCNSVRTFTFVRSFKIHVSTIVVSTSLLLSANNLRSSLRLALLQHGEPNELWRCWRQSHPFVWAKHASLLRACSLVATRRDASGAAKVCSKYIFFFSVCLCLYKVLPIMFPDLYHAVCNYAFVILNVTILSVISISGVKTSKDLLCDFYTSVMCS